MGKGKCSGGPTEEFHAFPRALLAHARPCMIATFHFLCNAFFSEPIQSGLLTASKKDCRFSAMPLPYTEQLRHLSRWWHVKFGTVSLKHFQTRGWSSKALHITQLNGLSNSTHLHVPKATLCLLARSLSASELPGPESPLSSWQHMSVRWSKDSLHFIEQGDLLELDPILRPSDPSFLSSCTPKISSKQRNHRRLPPCSGAERVKQASHMYQCSLS
jgi:hypothetical protein